MTVRFWELQDNLRVHIWARIHRGELTGQGLARQAGLQQAHISNFLNQRRGLSLQSIDRLLEALGIDLLDLVKRTEIQQRALDPPVKEVAMENVPVALLHEEAHLPGFRPGQLRESLSFRTTFLRKLRPHPVGERRDWLRFVITTADAGNARSMFPRISSGARLLLDRHYNSLEPYRRSQPNLYAVRAGSRCLIRYVSLAEDRVVLRPQNQQAEVEVITIEPGKTYADYIVGRVCHVAFEV